MKRLSKWAAAALLVVAAAILFFRAFPHHANREGEGGASRENPIRVRPGTVYKPKAEPLRHAPRPVLPVKPAAASIPVETGALVSGGGDNDDDDEIEEGEEIPPPPDIPPNDPALLAFAPELEFSALAWAALESSDDELLVEGARLLDSASPDERALGGVMLFFANGLEGNALESIVADEDPLVPLTVCDWIRDFGSEKEIEDFKTALKSRDMPSEELFAVASESAGLPGGGRSALDLWLEEFAGEDVPVENLAALVAAQNASYDVREQALFKLLEPETKAVGLEALEAFAKGLGSDAGVLEPFVAEKMADLARTSNADGDEEKIWDSESAVVFFLSQSEGGLPARDLANYLEYGLRRDDPEFEPVIEEGTWEFANDFLLKMMPLSDSLPQTEIDALDRIAMSLDRLVDYDPAFNPFETVEDDGEEDDAEEADTDDADEDDDADSDEADDDTDEEDEAADEDEGEEEDDADEEDSEEDDSSDK